ncbi:succinate--CoA ligase subunit alpha [Sedimentibacter hydroxybenzoicus DSM 7310]|uniref:Succinate--CoA ligase [ADP-forming] subunit alpha n=1 Tax=Sedimentibacter hydroxybenzoicus DSM 7310 TaxID=1123245 RepID=A0A974BGQ1_SEDHY|nr:succinate--CoA ligase subunit alpha [Sedimentibacter hydroxybenzoicus]NYB72763.1 succinate--CoA ligase subunit alpha [Sedimentibacter hydroxybenzoicus DSM 7310]
MSILVNENTKLIIQGITGREGTFHAEQMLQYGTKVVAGVSPGKGGQTICGIPVFDTVREAKEATDADATILFVPAKYTSDGVKEAIDAGVELIITIAEHVPVKDMMEIYHLSKRKNCKVIGPNSFGIISPGKSKAGFMAHKIFSEGSVGVMSRSATNCYETVSMMTKNNIGQSTCIGVGGDMIPGSTFVELLPLLEADPQTKAVVIIGEIGGNEEELAAEYIKNNMTKPVVALIAGKNAPKGKSMGHAGAIVSADGTGSAENKEMLLKQAGVHIAESTEHIVSILKEIM